MPRLGDLASRLNYMRWPLPQCRSQSLALPTTSRGWLDANTQGGMEMPLQACIGIRWRAPGSQSHGVSQGPGQSGLQITQGPVWAGWGPGRTPLREGRAGNAGCRASAQPGGRPPGAPKEGRHKLMNAFISAPGLLALACLQLISPRGPWVALGKSPVPASFRLLGAPHSGTAGGWLRDPPAPRRRTGT